MGEPSGDSPAKSKAAPRRKKAEPATTKKPAAATSKRRSTPKPAPEEAVGPKVLVVDDDDEIRELLRLSLSLRGWIVAEAVTGAEALERLGEVKPDVVLLDYQMPGMSGIECATAMREASAELRIILASAYVDASLTKRARDLRILPIAKAEHERLFDLFGLLAEQIQQSRTRVS
jgi:CheY-like chemotaxis protein